MFLGSKLSKKIDLKRAFNNKNDKNNLNDNDKKILALLTMEIDNGEKVKIELIDSLGEENFESLEEKLSEQGCKQDYAVALIYSQKDDTSFESLNSWKTAATNQLKCKNGKVKIVAVLGIKAKENEDIQVNDKDAKQFAKELGVSFYLIDTNKDERETIFKIAKEVLGIDIGGSKCSCCLII